MRKVVVISLINLALATSSAPTFAAWGPPGPIWFRHSCASPGARFTNARYCNARLARTAIGYTAHHRADTKSAERKPKAQPIAQPKVQNQNNSYQYNSYLGGGGSG